MLSIGENASVRDILQKSAAEQYTEYILGAYGSMTVATLIEAIQNAKPIGCSNDHEFTGQSYLECPYRRGNLVCSHQYETDDIMHPERPGEVAIPKEQQFHVTGLLRTGVAILAEAGQTAHLEAGEPITQAMLSTNAKNVMSVDNPAFLEYDRFRPESHFAKDSPSLDEREKDRLPSLKAATTLVQLRVAINKVKMTWKSPMEKVTDAVVGALQALLKDC